MATYAATQKPTDLGFVNLCRARAEIDSLLPMCRNWPGLKFRKINFGGLSAYPYDIPSFAVAQRGFGLQPAGFTPCQGT